MNNIKQLLPEMVKDLERTREFYHGYSYVRTMRNILTANEKAVIAPYFKGKEYYGACCYIELHDLEDLLDSLVRTGVLMVVYTDHGKLYCTHEYHDYLCKKS